MPEVALARATLRMQRRVTLLWGVAFAVVVYGSAIGYAGAYPTALSRLVLAASLEHNTGLAALFGTPHGLGSVSGFTAWRSEGVLSIAGAVWGLLLGTRLLRGQEEDGRWELVAAGATDRVRATAAVGAGAAGALGLLWLVTLAGTLAAGRVHGADQSLSAALRLAGALIGPTAVFTAVGLVCSQLLGTRRAASAAAGTVFGACYLVRMAAARGTAPGWLHTASIIGWFDNAASGSTAWLLASLALAAALGAVAVFLAGKRDTGAGLLAVPKPRRSRSRRFGNRGTLALQLSGPRALGWLAGAAAAGGIVGMLAKAVGGSLVASGNGRTLVSRITGGSHSGEVAFLGVAMVTISTLVALSAATQAASLREEEQRGVLEPVLAATISRTRWLVERCGIALAALVLAGLCIGLTEWLGAAMAGTHLGVGTLVGAGLNLVPYAAVVLGVGVAAFGVAPRLTAPVAFGVIAWSFLLDLVGSLVRAPAWLLDLSLLHHLVLLPAGRVNWSTDIAFVAIAAGLIATGLLWFRRRDIPAT